MSIALPEIVTIRPCPVPLMRPGDAAFRLDVAERRGELHRVALGVYAPKALWDLLPPWDRYLARVHAHALLRPGAVFALESAAVLAGLPIVGEPTEIHVLSADGTSRLVGRVRTHVSTDQREIIRMDGIAFVAPADTAVDIARHRHPALGLMTADALLRLTPALDAGHLLELNELRTSARGRAAARWPLTRATPLAESSLESISRAGIEWLGYPAPELQVVFRTSAGDVFRVDMYWRAQRRIGEADGDLKYDGESGRARLREEKRREDILRRGCDGFARWGWGEARDPDALDAALRASGLRPERPRVAAPLLTLPAAIDPPRGRTATPR